jgi:hypothetical protein
MTYELYYSDEAEEDLRRLPPDLVNFVEANLLRLAYDPTLLSRPARYPYPFDCQLYHFDRPPFDPTDPFDVHHYFAVLFRYRSDEQSLQILSVGHH